MTDYTTSSGNVFKDLDLPSPDERLAKAKLAYKINRLITDRDMTQKEAADLLQMRKSKMTNLRNGRLQGFTVNYLSALLEKLEHQVELTSKSITPLA
jgi:predicted XRE-type DNA-binding protein